jgi:putative DNA methylase
MRRPLVACRAAVYGALVPASQFVPENGPDNKKQSLGRANAAKFVTELCKYPGSPRVIAEAQTHILDAHADRLTAELAEAARTGQWPSGRGPSSARTPRARQRCRWSSKHGSERKRRGASENPRFPRAF